MSSLLDHPRVYRLLQAPFVGRKLRPFLATGAAERARRVLDVACGPGTNAPCFDPATYTGIDLDPRRVAHARRRFGGRFHVADARTFTPEERFDCILVNSFLHHLDDDDAAAVLRRLAGLLTDDGRVHVLDLVLPERPGLARWLARRDRGDHPRPLEAWRALLEDALDPLAFEPYAVRGMGVALWHMVYFRGRAR